MPFFDRLRALAASPAWVCAIAAVALRLALLIVSWDANPLLRYPQLDAMYYVDWADRIVGGEWLAGGPVIPGTLPEETAHLPYFLNPLLAYVVALFRAVAGPENGPILVRVAHCLLAGGTAAFAATTAGRLFGRTAAWTAGVLCAFSAALTQLDLNIAVSGLAAFLVAGAMWSTLPAPRQEQGHDGKRRFSDRLRGPLATGVWLGVGALARPVTMFAVPLAAWLYASREAGRRRWRVAALCALGFVAAILPSPLRNLAISGEPVLFTAASGANLYLGNNPATRKYRTMSANDRFRFNPFEMHADARRYMSERIGPDASWGEISSRFTRDGIEEFIRAPGASVLFYLNKARWFFAPEEVPSSASFAMDREYVPALRLAFVPTWLIATLGLVGFLVFVKRRDVSLGPGGLALAHGFVLTVVFPLSHYRSPAIPALAVLAGGAVAVLVGREGGAAAVDPPSPAAPDTPGHRRRRLVAAALAVACIVAAWVPPRPSPMTHNGLLTAAIAAEQRGLSAADADEQREALEEALSLAQRGLEAHGAAFPDDPPLAFALFIAMRVAFFDKDYEKAIRLGHEGLEVSPFDWPERMTVIMAWYHLGRPDEMIQELDEAVRIETAGDLREHPAILSRYCEAYFLKGDMGRARDYMDDALERAREPRDRPLDFIIERLRGQ